MTWTIIKSLWKVPKISAQWPERSKTASQQESLQNHNQSALDAHTLHTCSNQKRFRKHIFEKTRMSRNCVQSITFRDHNVAFAWVLQSVLEALQNRSEKHKSARRSAQFELWVGVYSRFRKVHAKSVIIVQTVGLEGAKGRCSRWKLRSGEHMYAKPQREHDLNPKRFKLERPRGTRYKPQET